MSLNGAMNAGVTGMKAQGAKAQAVAGNLSTLGARAAKAERIVFLPVITGNDSTGGVFYIKKRDMSQGLIEPDSSGLSWAIAGNGFFAVASNKDNTAVGQEFLYSRNGEFYKDKEGYLRNTSGHYLMGVATDQLGQMPATFAGQLTDLVAINISQVKPYFRASTEVNIAATLPATASPADVLKSSIPVVDSLGGKHTLTISYTKTANDKEWQITMTCEHVLNVQETNGAGPAYDILVVFATDGTIASIDGSALPAATAPDIHLAWNPAALASLPAAATLTFSLGAVGASTGLGISGSKWSPTLEESNGVESGNFSKVSVSESGLLEAHFQNGGSTPLYQLMLANFDNPNALEAREGGTYIQTTDSGQYSLRRPKESGLGKVIPNALESSNVDSASEFTALIQTQSNFAMNAKSVQFANEMLDVLSNIKR